MLSAISSRIENRSLVGSDLVILIAIIADLAGGVIFATTEKASGSIGMAALLSVFGYRFIASPVMIISACLAIFGQWQVGLRPLTRFLLLLPQVVLLIIGMFGAVAAIGEQHYADMVHRTWVFILCDQRDRLAMPLIYGAAIYARIRTP